MTASEQRRDDEQRRMTDTVREYENVRVDAQVKMVGIIIATCTFFGSIIIYMAMGVAKDVVDPIAKKVLINENDIRHINMNTERILQAVQENNRLIRELDKK